MKYINAVLICISIFAGGCSDTTSNSSKRSVQIDGGTLGWVDFLDVSKIHRDAFPQKDGESIYLFSFSRPVSVKLSNGQTITNSEGAEDVSCIRQLPPQQSNELFGECLRKLSKANDNQNRNNADRARLIAQAERAVRSEGTCQWLGYDRSIDQSMRAVGAAARQNDDNLIFAKMKCS